MVALVTVVAAVAIVLGWVVVRRVGWRRDFGRRIQGNDTARVWILIVFRDMNKPEAPADDAVFAAKVLQERGHFVLLAK